MGNAHTVQFKSQGSAQASPAVSKQNKQERSSVSAVSTLSPQTASSDISATSDPGAPAGFSLKHIPIFRPEASKSLRAPNHTGLPDTLKSGVEKLSGLSLDDVHVHYRSVQPARVRALAYTQGSTIHVESGQEQHLAHEAWHVVQQKLGRVRPTGRVNGTAVNDDERLESEADLMGSRAAALRTQTEQTFSQPETPMSANPEKMVDPATPIQRAITKPRKKKYKKKRNKSLYGTENLDKYKRRYALRRYQWKKKVKKDESPSGEEESQQSESSSESEKEESQPDESEKEEDVDVDEEGENEEEEDVDVDEGTAANTRTIGLASWNVAHFSGHDIEGTLKKLQKQLSTFAASEKEWKAIFATFDKLLNTIKKDSVLNGSTKGSKPSRKKQKTPGSPTKKQWVPKKPKGTGGTKQTLRRSGRERTPVEHYQGSGFSDSQKFKGVQDAEGRRNALLKLIESYKTEKARFDVNAFAANITELAEFPWQEEYEKIGSPKERVKFAAKVKELRKVADDITQAEQAFASLRELQKFSTFLNKLEKKTSESAEKFFKDLKKVKDVIPKKTIFDTAARSLHSPNIVKHIDEMFENNSEWLDVLLLQEVNNPALLRKGKHPYKVFQGPQLESGGTQPQREFYPLLVRKGSGITVKGAFAVMSNGTFEPKSGLLREPDERGRFTVGQEEESAMVEAEPEKPKKALKKSGKASEKEAATAESWKIKWNKRATSPTYRPIIVYEIEKQSQEKRQTYWVGIVHTTPETDSSGVAEFNRRAIFGEVRLGLQNLEAAAQRKNIPLIIGGDYYLSAEAIVTQGKEAEHTQENQESEKSRKAIKELIKKIDAELKPSSQTETSAKRQSSKKRKKSTKSELASVEDIGEEEEIDTQKNLLRKIRLVLQEASKKEQILRNIHQLTMAKQVEKLSLYLAQTVSGTNPKKDPLDNWYYLQIADFFVHNAQLPSFTTGIMRPEGGMLSVDKEATDNPDDELHYSKYWQHFSDHFPVGVVYSMDEQDLSRHPAMVGSTSEKAEELANTSNINRFARLEIIGILQNKNRKKKSQSLNKTLAKKVEKLRGRKGTRSKYNVKKLEELEGLTSKDKELLAKIYLKNYITSYFGSKRLKDNESINWYIKYIQKLEKQKKVEQDCLFVTLPGDFEPDLGEKSSGSKEEEGGSDSGIQQHDTDQSMSDADEASDVEPQPKPAASQKPLGRTSKSKDKGGKGKQKKKMVVDEQSDEESGGGDFADQQSPYTIILQDFREKYPDLVGEGREGPQGTTHATDEDAPVPTTKQKKSATAKSEILSSMRKGRRAFKDWLSDHKIKVAYNGGSGLNCLIISLLQHATGNYSGEHGIEADELRKELIGDLGSQAAGMLHSDGPACKWLVEAINEQHKVNMKPIFVRSDADGHPFILPVIGTGTHPVVIWDQGGHYEALYML